MIKILVLPFHVSKEIIDADYILEGIVEELIDLISEHKNLATLSRNTSFYLRENPKSRKELIDEFGIEYIIEGSIKEVADKNLLSIRLINASTDEIVGIKKGSFKEGEWATFINEQAIELLLHIDQKIPLVKHPLVKGSAKELYLKGLYHWNRYTYNEMKLAIPYFQKSIQADPDFAPAYAGLANCYSVIAIMAFEDVEPAFKKALTNVNRALALNDKHSESYLCAAFINLFYQFDYDQTGINLNHALKLNKNNSKTHHLFSFYYAFLRDFNQSEKHCTKAIELDPLSIPSYVMFIRLQLYKKDVKRAQDAIDGAFLIERSAMVLHEFQGLTYLIGGNIESAIETFNYCIQQDPTNLLYYGYLSYAYAVSGFYEESLSIERQLDEVEDRNKGGYAFAKVYIYLGRRDYDRFFLLVNKAIDEGIPTLFGDILNNPMYSEIRKDKRYAAVLQRGNLNRAETIIRTRKPSSVFTLLTNTKESLELDPQDIAFIEGEGNYCTVFWYSKNILVKKILRVTLKQLEEQLEKYPDLIRCHKSFIVNIDENMAVIGNSKYAFIESPLIPIRVPISRKKQISIREHLARL